VRNGLLLAMPLSLLGLTSSICFAGKTYEFLENNQWVYDSSNYGDTKGVMSGSRFQIIDAKPGTTPDGKPKPGNVKFTKVVRVDHNRSDNTTGPSVETYTRAWSPAAEAGARFIPLEHFGHYALVYSNGLALSPVPFRFAVGDKDDPKATLLLDYFMNWHAVTEDGLGKSVHFMFGPGLREVNGETEATLTDLPPDS